MKKLKVKDLKKVLDSINDIHDVYLVHNNEVVHLSEIQIASEHRRIMLVSEYDSVENYE